MKIHIKDSLYVESDDRQFIIKEYNGKQDKQGNDIYKIHGYFGSMVQVVKHLIKMEVMKSEAKSLSELVADINRIEKEIEEKIKY
jgi:predicted Rossmann-fold nucleotide-binding protein